MPPTAGTIRYEKDQHEIEIDDVFRSLSIAAPYMDLIDEFTLSEQLRFHFTMRKQSANRSMDEMMKEMYLYDSRDKYIGNFSSGMKQRLKLALTFFTESDALFLDEPGTNLDRSAFQWYLDQLQKLPKDRLIFIASNQPEEYPSDAVKVDIMTYK
jgi:ABC-type multidrug transport system ATPase subunit